MPMTADAIDTRALRQVLGAFVTGVTVVTTLDGEGRPQGLTANSFSSVSLDPPLVLWSQALGALSHPVFREAERFVINILAEDQIDVSNRFARAGEDKFGGTAIRPGIGNLPLIEGCAAYLECRRIAGHLAGDHMIFIGQVERIERTASRPLAFGGGKYLMAHAHDFGALSAEEDASNRLRLKAVRLATHAAIELSGRIGETIGLGVWGNYGPTIVHWELSPTPVTVNLRVGAVLPVLGSATGLVFLAWLPPGETAPFVAAEMASGSEASRRYAADPALLDATLGSIREEGSCAITTVSRFVDREAVAVNAVSVPVFDREGKILLALTALAERTLLDVSAGAPVPVALEECAARLTRRLRAS